MKAKFTTLFLLLAAPLLHAQVTPTLMSYQGRVTDAAGVLIGNTTPLNRAVTFKLYSLSSGGTALYAETQAVTISGGEFSVLIGNGTGITGSPGPSSPATTPYKSLADIVNSGVYSSLYLGITVDDGTSAADPEISPRQQMVSGAFALRAKVAESVAGGSVTSTMLGDEQVGTTKIAPNAVNGSRITDLTIEAIDIKDSVITATKLDANTVGVWTPVGSSVYRNNNVGIGEANPGFPLNFGSVLGEKISLYGRSGANFGFGIQNSLLQIYTSAAAHDVAFGYGTSASFTETMRVRGNGNVGIGTTTPAERLVVAGTAQADRIYSNGIVRARGGSYGANGNNAGFSFDSNGDTDGGMFSGADGTLQFYTNGAERLRLDSGGKLGIGNTAPTSMLTIGNTFAGSAYSSTLSTNSGALGGTNGNEVIMASFGCTTPNTSSLAISAYRKATTNVWESAIMLLGMNVDDLKRPGGYMAFSNTGIGIGTVTPQAPLHVTGSGAATSFYLGAYLGGDGAKDTNENRTDLAYSIIASGRTRSAAFDVESDSRIKTLIERSDAAADLTTLLGIRISDYHFKDRVSNGDIAQKKVIAQQVEEVYPQAVNRGSGVVPDIYQKATVKDGWVNLTTDLKIGERVQLVGEQGKETHEVLEIREGGFRTGFEPATEEIFVYGREVKDFRSVDYDAIAMLNVSATQQLKKEKDAEINALKSKNSELEARLSALEKMTAGK